MIPHNQPSIGQEEADAIREVIKSKWIAPGLKVAQFEHDFAQYVRCKHAIAVNSGTAALTVALQLLGVGNEVDKTEVMLPTYACSALLNAVYFHDAWPILEDIGLCDFNISMIHPHLDNPIAIVAHTFGVPMDIKKMQSLGITVIEDCCQALGSFIKGKHVGLKGDMGVFSFGPSKMISCGSGGMIVTNNDEYAQQAREYIDYDKHIPAFNFGMNDIAASMGIVQLKKLPHFITRRVITANIYISICKDKGWDFQGNSHCEDYRNWYRFVILGDFVQDLKQYLFKNGVTAIIPIEQKELLHNMLGMDKSNYPNAEYVASHTLSLPIYPDLLDEGFEKIIELLRKYR